MTSSPHLTKFYDGGEFKWEVLRTMPSFGKRGIPIIRDSLGDQEMRLTAIVCARHLGKDDVELVPDLLSLRRTYGHPYIDDALFAIDPAQFPRNKN